MQKIFLFLVILFGANVVSAQKVLSEKQIRREEKRQRINSIIRLEEEGVLTYTKHLVAGFKLTNDGYGGFVEYAKAQSVKRSLLFQLDFSERKNLKELKQQYDFGPTSPWIYGKINYFYPVKLGVQQQLLLGNKGNKNGVCVTANFGGGLSLAMLRPYLVQVSKGGGNYVFVGYDSPDRSYFLNGPFVGGPTISTGWNNLKVTPGAYLKTAARFDYGRYNELVSAVEIGAFVEYYGKKIPQMIEIKQLQTFMGAYVSVVFGRRK